MYAGTVETYGFPFIFGKHFMNSEIPQLWKELDPNCQKHHCQSRLTRRGQRVHLDIDSSHALHSLIRQTLDLGSCEGPPAL